MSFKIGSTEVIVDSGYTGTAIRGHVGTYGSSNPLGGDSSGYTLNFNNTSQVVEITFPDKPYQSKNVVGHGKYSKSNLIRAFENFDSGSAINHFYMKINGKSEKNGFTTGKLESYYSSIYRNDVRLAYIPSDDLGSYDYENLSPSNARTMHMDIDRYTGKKIITWFTGQTRMHSWDVDSAYGIFLSNPDSFNLGALAGYSLSTDSAVGSFHVVDSGRKIVYIAANRSYARKGRVRQLNLSTPWDVSTASADSNFRLYIPSRDVDGNAIDSIDSAEGIKAKFGAPSYVQGNNYATRILDFSRSGDRALLTNDTTYSYDKITAVVKLDNPFDLSKITGVESYGFHNNIQDGGGGGGFNATWSKNWKLDLDQKTLRGVGYPGGYNSRSKYRYHKWKDVWTVHSTHDSTWDSLGGGTFLYHRTTSGIWMPGGHAMVGTERGQSTYNARMARWTFTDSTTTMNSSLTFPDNVKWQGGIQPDFPDSGKELWCEFLSFDSGNNWYAKEVYRN